jgi:peptidyl-prolyl cis-trans isomerase A (cyclophilin A)
MRAFVTWRCPLSIAAGLILLPACKESMHPNLEEPTSKAETAPAQAEQKPVAPTQSARTEEPKREVTSDGYEVVRAGKSEGEGANLAVKAPPGWELAQPPDSKDPHDGKFSLEEALKGLPPKGALQASIRTSLGTLECKLFDDKAPKTVANFVGLARGVRKFWSGKDHAWVARPYYDGTTFHRVIPEFMIQGGDWKGDGSGAMYYTIPDELHPSLKHDRGGLLCMANRGPNTNEAQFFITEDAAPHLDGSYSIFGECGPVELVKRIARVPQSGPPNNRPLTSVVIEKVSITRGSAPATAAPEDKDKPAGIPKGEAVRVPAPEPK